MLIHWARIREHFSDMRWLVAAMMVALLCIAISPFVEERRWPSEISLLAVVGVTAAAAAAFAVITLFGRRPVLRQTQGEEAIATIARLTTDGKPAARACIVLMVADQLIHDLYIDFVINVYNGGDVPIVVTSVDGSMQHDSTEFPSPPTVVGKLPMTVNARSDAEFTLRQHMIRALAIGLSNRLSAGDSISLVLQSIVISIARQNQPSITYPLHLWDAIKLARSTAVVGRMVRAAGRGGP